MKRLVKQLRHGQITIPKEFRKALKLEDNDMLAVSLADGKLELEPVRLQPMAVGSPWAKDLYDLFAPVREATHRASEDEINEAIDGALKEVRSRKE